jgi:hypothetical protein
VQGSKYFVPFGVVHPLGVHHHFVKILHGDYFHHHFAETSLLVWYCYLAGALPYHHGEVRLKILLVAVFVIV